ncbi:protease complex subunit PrcB family protein [Flavobacterium sp. TMP13]|uniref:protease complex subunit PrcB family protein n=1 Tax=Flavobacterium sp. TMP13 TaxID=3425950 RepID=UPI003D78366C
MKKSILLLLLVGLSSCTATKEVSAETGKLYEVLTQQSNGGGNIQFYEILSEPREIRMLMNDELLKDKIDEKDIVKSNFVVLNMGERNTGGYSITVVNAEETATSIILTVKESTPPTDAMVTQNITYPYTVVKINSKKEISIK